MSIIEELHRLQNEAEVNETQIQKLRYELRLIDISNQTRHAASNKHKEQAETEVQRLESNITALSELTHPITSATNHILRSIINNNNNSNSKITEETTTTPKQKFYSSSSSLLSQSSSPLVHANSSFTVPRERLMASVAELELQNKQLLLIQKKRQTLEEFIQRVVRQYPQYHILEYFNTQQEMERVALSRILQRIS